MPFKNLKKNLTHTHTTSGASIKCRVDADTSTNEKRNRTLPFFESDDDDKYKRSSTPGYCCERNVRSSPTGYIMMLALSIKRVICEVLCVCVCYGIYEHFREVLVAAFYRLCAEETLD